MGLFTRSQPEVRTLSLQAAANNVKLDDSRAMKATMAKHSTWEDEAWAYYDEVPEIKFGVNFSANAMTKVEFFAACMNLDGSIVRVNDETSPLLGTPAAIQADAEIARLKAEMGGQGELNRLAEINLEVPGQFYLFGRAARTEVSEDGEVTAVPETWDVLSIESVIVTQETDSAGRPLTYVKYDPDDKNDDRIQIDPDKDALIHAYLRHPRWKKRADSHMRALLTDAQTLVALNNQVLAESRSRMNAGLLLVPKEVQFEQSANPRDPAQFVKDLVEALVTPIEDPTDQRSLVPTILRGNKEDLGPDALRRLDLSRSTDENVDSRILQRIDRIARGLNVPVEVVMGHMATTFANAEQVDQDTFDDHLEPKCRLLAEIYGYAFLRPQLMEASRQMQQTAELDALLEPDTITLVDSPPPRGITPEDIAQIFVWFDASSLVRTRDPDSAPEDALKLGALSLAAYRKRRNIEETEAPTAEEIAMMMAVSRGPMTTALTSWLLQQAGIPIPPDIAAATDNAPAAAPAPGSTNGATPAITAAASEDAAPDPFDDGSLGRSLLEIDRDLRARIHGAAEAAMERALERAGGKLKSKRSVVAVVGSACRATHVAAQLGPALVANAGYDTRSLLDGAWTVLERQFKEWCLTAANEAVALIEGATVAFTDAEKDEHRRLLRAAVETAWEFLATELDVLAAARLYDPEGDGDIPIFGRIPTGVIREALTIAGGDAGIYTVIAAGVPSKPAGGVATGKLSNDLAESNGISTPKYRWVYGPAHRDHEFHPHRELNGKTFTNFNDSVLRNSNSFPAASYYYPGDHIGCSCDVEPIMEIITVPSTTTKAAKTKPATTKPAASAAQAIDHYNANFRGYGDGFRQIPVQNRDTWMDAKMTPKAQERHDQIVHAFAQIDEDSRTVVAKSGVTIWAVPDRNVDHNFSGYTGNVKNLAGSYQNSTLTLYTGTYEDKVGTTIAHEVGHAIDAQTLRLARKTGFKTTIESQVNITGDPRWGELFSHANEAQAKGLLRAPPYYLQNKKELFAEAFNALQQPEPRKHLLEMLSSGTRVTKDIESFADRIEAFFKDHVMPTIEAAARAEPD